jgi:hypothetical protein
MAGLTGNQASLAWSKQTAKGTPNTTYTRRAPFAGGSIGPSRVIQSLAETDSNRDQGVSYVSQTGAAGTPMVYGRDDVIDGLIAAALGSPSSSGTTNYTHTIVPANTLPYLGFYRELGNTLFEQFDDCLINELTISADAGSPVQASIDILGLTPTRLASAAGSLPALASSRAYTYNDATVTLAGSATSAVSAFELTINNNLSVQQTDGSTPYDIAVGQREVTLGFTLIFETLAEYNRFHYGGTSGTAVSTVLPTIAADFQFDNGANNQLKFSLPAITYEEFPVEPNVAGDPVTVDVRARAQRSGSNILTAIVKNQKATVWT